jgi:hypothetical protein
MDHDPAARRSHRVGLGGSRNTPRLAPSKGAAEDFITHSSEVPASWLVQDGDAPPPVTLISPTPSDNELFC